MADKIIKYYEDENILIWKIPWWSGNDLWYFATELALTTAHPTASAGNYAIVGSTDTVWIWDTDTSDWVNSGTSSMWDMTKSVYDPNTVEDDAFDSANHNYDNTTSWLTATTTKTAIDEVNTNKQDVLSEGAFVDWDKTKLDNIEDWAEVNVNADWDSDSGDSEILNKPTLATVATSWSYDDLSDKPSIPDNTDYVDLTDTQTVAWVKTFSSIPVWPNSNPTTDNQLARKKYVDDWLNTKPDNLQEAFNWGQTITIADWDNKTLTITNNDTTNNQNTLEINTNKFAISQDWVVMVWTNNKTEFTTSYPNCIFWVSWIDESWIYLTSTGRSQLVLNSTWIVGAYWQVAISFRKNWISKTSIAVDRYNNGWNDFHIYNNVLNRDFLYFSETSSEISFYSLTKNWAIFIDNNYDLYWINIDSEATTKQAILYDVTINNDVASFIAKHNWTNKFQIMRNDDTNQDVVLVLWTYHLWVDSTGDLRIKSSAPTSDTDWTIVWTQS